MTPNIYDRQVRKVEVLLEGHKILQNHYFKFEVYYIGTEHEWCHPLLDMLCSYSVKSKVEISKKIPAFSGYLNFISTVEIEISISYLELYISNQNGRN